VSLRRRKGRTTYLLTYLLTLLPPPVNPPEKLRNFETHFCGHVFRAAAFFDGHYHKSAPQSFEVFKGCTDAPAKNAAVEKHYHKSVLNVSKFFSLPSK